MCLIVSSPVQRRLLPPLPSPDHATSLFCFVFYKKKYPVTSGLQFLYLTLHLHLNYLPWSFCKPDVSTRMVIATNRHRFRVTFSHGVSICVRFWMDKAFCRDAEGKQVKKECGRMQEKLWKWTHFLPSQRRFKPPQVFMVNVNCSQQPVKQKHNLIQLSYIVSFIKMKVSLNSLPARQ